MKNRLSIARDELQRAGEFDAWIVNRDLDQAAAELYGIMACRARPAGNKPTQKGSGFHAKDGGRRGEPCRLPL